MKPKKKAKELVDKYKKQLDTATPTLYRPIYQAKQCALIAVDEIINSVDNKHVSDIYDEFWENVKQEIDKL